MKQLISGEEARPAKRQHKTPCSDCPWARRALPGWLGNPTADEWLRSAHGESLIDCHTRIGMQCAGSAIYRANMAKVCRSPEILTLPPNKLIVFATPMEFKAHHEKGPSGKKED
jgi:hypothetical protein